MKHTQTLLRYARRRTSRMLRRFVISLHNIVLAARSYRCYVIADPNDNSIVFSKRLWHHILRNSPPDAHSIFSFRISQSGLYAFTIGAPNPQAACANVQYNDTFKCIGFESLCPSVGTIFYNYNIPHNSATAIHITPFLTPDRRMIYILRRPRFISKH